jgi:hypothetical protein
VLEIPMLKSVGLAALAAGALSLSGCGPKPPPTPSVHASMAEIIEPQAQTIWDITSTAYNAKGDGLDASKLTEADWAKLDAAAAALRDRARLLAKTPRVTAAGPDETIMGQDASHAGSKRTWDAASAKQVQALIDSNPNLFADRARVLAMAGDSIVRASKTRDVRTLYDVSSGLDEVCDGCHVKFWGTDENPPFPK